MISIISYTAEAVLFEFHQHLTDNEGLCSKTVGGHISDLCDFIHWYESWGEDAFRPANIATTTITSYQSQLQESLAPASVNRQISTLKRYFAFAVSAGQIASDPSIPVNVLHEVSS